VALHTSDLVGVANHRRPGGWWSWERNIKTRAILETTSFFINRGAPQASSTISEENCVGRGHRTKPVALNRTSKWLAIVPFGFGEPKLFADCVGVNLGEAVSANSTPYSSSTRCRRGKEVDVALVVAKSTGDGDSNGLRGSRLRSKVDLGLNYSDGESSV